jgi:hypothetical protein
MSDKVNGLEAINKHKEASKEMKEIFKKNGSLADYQKEIKNSKIERYNEDELKIDFYKLLS